MMQEVACIDGKLHLQEYYYIDLDSVTIDFEGDSSACVYANKDKETYMGRFYLKHFQSIRNLPDSN